MSEKIFNSLEMDAIGEILNISLGASATAVSTMLDRRVDITVPTVMISSKDTFEFTYMEPAVAVEITYVSGLSGNNIMLLKRHDVKVIVEILMGTEIPEDEFELNDINMSAIREVMNQMMGSSSTALAELIGESVNISTPTSFEINTVAEFAEKYLLDNEPMVVVRFSLKVENSLESEFLNIMTVDLARKLISGFGLPAGMGEEAPAIAETQEMNYPSFEEPEEAAEASAEEEPVDLSAGRMMSQEDIEKLLSQSMPPTPEPPTPEPPTPEPPTPEPPAPAKEEPKSAAQPEPPKAASQPSNTPGYVPGEPKVIQVKRNGELSNIPGGQERAENLDLIMGVPLEISVEIGRTKKNVREILEYNKGSLIVLDKLAGEQVDIFVNGQCIAKGDVVVVDDNFGVRVTEVLKKF